MSKTFIVFLAGITVGVLIAPHKGSKTRSRIRNFANDVCDGVESIVEKIGRRTDSVSMKAEKNAI